MEIDLAQELRSVWISFALGMAGGLFYDLLRAFRLRYRRKKLLTNVLDGGFALAVGFFMLYLTTMQGQGQLRLHMVLSLLAGGLFWLNFPGLYCRAIWEFWVDVLVQTAKILLWPGRKLCERIKKSENGKKKHFLSRGKCDTMMPKRRRWLCIICRKRRRGPRGNEEEKEIHLQQNGADPDLGGAGGGSRRGDR